MTEQDIRRHRLTAIAREYFEDDFDKIARVIAETTGQAVSVRSIQAWVIDPRRQSSRNVPERLLKAIADYVAIPDNAVRLKGDAARRSEKRFLPRSAWDYTDEVRANRAVEMATAELEDEERDRQKLRALAGTASGDELFSRFRALTVEVNSVSRALGGLMRAIDEGVDIADIKARAREYERTDGLNRYFVRDAKKSIADNENEFSTLEGLPPAANPDC